MERDFVFDAETVLQDGQIIYDRSYKADIFREYFYSFVGNGVFAEAGNALAVIAKTPEDMQVIVRSGKAWTEGAFYYNDDDLVLSFQPSDNTLNRIDAVVVRCDYVGRRVYATVVQGTPATTPAHYTPVRNTDVFELLLAEVYIPFASLNIKQQNITDFRAVSDVCGWVTGYLQSIDSDSFFEAYRASFTEFMEDSNATFEEFEAITKAWFNSVKDDIAAAAPFDFDNVTALPGCTYTYADGTQGTDYAPPILEEIRKTVETGTGRLIAKRTSTFPTETTMTIQTIRYAKDGVTEIDNTIQNINIETGDTIVTGTVANVYPPLDDETAEVVALDAEAAPADIWNDETEDINNE